VFSLGCAFLLHDRSKKVFDSLVPDLLTHLFLVHNLTALYPVGLGNGAFWSLGMEEQLYLLYFFLFFLIRKRSAIFASGVAVCTTVLWRLLITSTAMSSIDSMYGLGMWGMWPFAYWMHWALGALAVDAYFGNCRLPRWSSSLCAAVPLIFAGLMTNGITFKLLSQTSLGSHSGLQVWSNHVSSVSSLGELSIAAGFFCLMNWCVQNPQHILIRSRLSHQIAWLGKISYAIYLTHVPVLFVLEEYIPFTHSVTDWLLRMVVYLSVCLLIGTMFFYGVERWFLAGRCPVMWRRSNAGIELSGTSRSPTRAQP
jgi:peptidoglycan/LPS O-acetylase OafA/YrhL